MGPSLYLLPLVMWAACTQTEIATTDQAPYSANVLGISADGVELEVGDKPSVIPLDKLRRLSFAKPVADQGGGSGNAAGQATLRDGSQFRYQSFSLAGGSASFELDWDAALTLPAAAVQHVQLQQLTPPQWTQWQAIVQSRATADRLVLIRSADALEKLDGIVSAVGPAAVSFDFGGQAIDAPLAKLAGLCLFSASPAAGSASGSSSKGEEAKLSAIVRDRSGSRWMAAAISLPKNSQRVELQLLAGATFELPLEQLSEIDFSSGSTQYLADLQPLSRSSMKNAPGSGQSVSGALPLGLVVAGADDLFGPRPRSVRELGRMTMGPSLEFVGSGSISYRIPEGFTRLRGEVELTPSGNRFTPCQVSVLLENEVIWQERLSQTGRRWEVDVPVVADGRLRIEVAVEAQTPVGDIVLWHELRLVK